MTYVPEEAVWEEGIRQFELDDPVQGGPDGVDNIPLRQLANRTRYLKGQIAWLLNRLEQLETYAESGGFDPPAIPDPPVVKAGNNQNIKLRITNSATLTGSANPAELVASVRWEKVSGPSGGNISSPNSLSTAVTGLVEGEYIFRLRVTDTYDRSVSAQVSVKAKAAVTKLTSPAGLGTARSNLAAASVGNVILFGGGSTHSSGYTGTVDAYSVSGTAVTKLTNPANMSTAREKLAAASAGDVILFGGGGTTNGVYTGTVDAYSVSGTAVTKVASPADLQKPRSNLAAASAGDVILFGGGSNQGGVAGDYISIDTYSVSGTAVTKLTNPADMSGANPYLAAASAGNVILFGGGNLRKVDTYSVSGTAVTKLTNPADTIAGKNLAAASVGNVILFGGGYEITYSHTQEIVDAYSVSGTAVTKLTNPANMSTAREKLAAASAGDVILFGGGGTTSGVYTGTVDAYSVSGTAVTKLTNPADLGTARTSLTAASVGNVILFGGGGGNASDVVVDAYLVEA